MCLTYSMLGLWTLLKATWTSWSPWQGFCGVCLVSSNKKGFYSLSLTVFTFENLDVAKAAKEQLHGCDIYSGCCTLRTEYAKVRKAFIKLCSTCWLYKWVFCTIEDKDFCVAPYSQSCILQKSAWSCRGVNKIYKHLLQLYCGTLLRCKL